MNITGTSGNDYLVGLNSNDSIKGLGGNDSIDGGAGDDSLFGESGNDSLIGGAGNDSLNAGAGNDYLFGGLGGKDTLVGGDGSDTLDGSSVLTFDEPLLPSNISGGNGDDLLRSNYENETLSGGAGKDRFEVFTSSPYGKTRISGGDSDDYILFGGLSAVSSVNGGNGLADETVFQNLQYINTSLSQIERVKIYPNQVESQGTIIINPPSLGASYVALSLINLTFSEGNGGILVENTFIEIKTPVIVLLVEE